MAYTPRKPLQVGDVFESNHWGTLAVKEYVNAKHVVCVFDNTGNAGVFDASSLRRGLVVDSVGQKQAAIERKEESRAEGAKRLQAATTERLESSKAEWEGRIFESAHRGPFAVWEYKTATDIAVMFLNTGYVAKTTEATLRGTENPNVRDPLAPSVFGVGAIGVGLHASHDKGADTTPYSIWRAMLRRCYGKEIRPAYAGVTVCVQWLNFQAFAEWYDANHPGTPGLELDKDIKIPGNKIYRPEACQFVTKEDNLAARKW